ncbi:MAG: YggT family protein [Hyphomonadaceae bacterium]
MIGLLFYLINAILNLLLIVLLVNVVLSWLIAFDIVSRRNAFVNTVWTFTTRVTDPLLRPLRRIIPPISGVDLSVLVLMLLIFFIQGALPYLHGMLVGSVY